MTPEEINRRIATWAGLDSHVCDGWSFHCDDCERGSIQTPDYYRSNAAMDLLDVLVERRYSFKINGYVTTQFQVFIYCVTDDELPLETVSMAVHSTIPAAICTAILELIEREGKK